MSETAPFQVRCDFYAEIGAGVCDDCGREAKSHLGVRALKEGSRPFGGVDCWENLTWAEWKSRVERKREVSEARGKLAKLSDEDAVLLAWQLDHD